MSEKDIDAGPFDLVSTFFEPHKHSFANRLDNFFVDGDLLPLFVQENYLNAAQFVSHLVLIPSKSRLQPCIFDWFVQKWSKDQSGAIDAMVRAADTIALGDIMQTSVRSEQVGFRSF